MMESVSIETTRLAVIVAVVVFLAGAVVRVGIVSLGWLKLTILKSDIEMQTYTELLTHLILIGISFPGYINFIQPYS